jgi:hypothetical protein
MHPAEPGAKSDCVDIALEGEYSGMLHTHCLTNTESKTHRSVRLTAKELFSTMQRLSFFCQLPQDPKKLFITCERIPQ